LTVYEWGSPYWVRRHDNVAPSSEQIHARKYELRYDFETEQPLSYMQAEELYGQILASPEIPLYAKIKYFRIEQSSTAGLQVGRIYLQYESKHPIALSVIIAACITAFIIAATIAAIVFLVAPTLVGAYILTTWLLDLPKSIAAAIIIGVAGVVGYVGYKVVVGKPLREGGRAEEYEWRPEGRSGQYG